MRLTTEQVALITHTVTHLTDTGTIVYLFGSRLNDHAKGGDIDLLIESDTPLSLLLRAKIKMELEAKIGLPVDIVSKAHNGATSAFKHIAKSQAIQLGI